MKVISLGSYRQLKCLEFSILGEIRAEIGAAVLQSSLQHLKLLRAHLLFAVMFGNTCVWVQ